MTITPDHWIEGVRKDAIPGGSEMPTRRAVVIHFTSGATAQSSIDFWKSPEAKGALAHVIIDRDGTVTQIRAFNRTCGHAGKSRWRDPKTKKLYDGMNACSIGIELANAGDDTKLAKKWSKLPLIEAKHRNGGPVEAWEQYPPAQLASVTKLVDALVQRYKLDDITGHDCIAPERKNDPGPAFPMQELRESCGFSGLPAVHHP
jgi:N-acetylmuramoyl-L-alanine amidase